jgi:hypothetical protein
MQTAARSPLNKGGDYDPPIPGVGLAGDWPGAWTQTYSQLGTTAGFMGFERESQKWGKVVREAKITAE